MAFIFLGFISALIVFEALLHVLPACELIGPGKNSPSNMAPNSKALESKSWAFHIANIYTTNSDSFHASKNYGRTRDPQKSMVVIGDSFVNLLFLETQYTFAPTLERIFKEKNADMEVYNFAKSGGGLGDFYSFALMAKEKFGIQNYAIMLSYGDIAEDLGKTSGHFCYSRENSQIKLVYMPQKPPSNLRYAAILRYMASNLSLTPATLKNKLSATLGLKTKTEAAAQKTHLLPQEKQILEKFLGDIKALCEKDTSRAIFLAGNKNRNVDLEIFSIIQDYGFEFVDLAKVDNKNFAFTEKTTYHNDGHWNRLGIRRVSTLIAESKFAQKFYSGK